MLKPTIWHIMSKLGEGQSAIVYKVRSSETQNEYAAKVTISATDKSLILEADIHNKLSHPCILQFITSFYGRIEDNSIIEVSDDNIANRYVIVLELCDKNLSAESKARHLSENDLIVIFSRLLEVIVYLKEKGVVHADIKPDNIIMCGGVPKLADFGLAHWISEKVRKLKGTAYHVAPEIWQLKEYSNKSDIWALGVTLYRIKIGRAPFNAILGTTDEKLVRKQLTNAIKTETPYIPRDTSKLLGALLLRMLEKDPNLRPSADELLKDPFFTPAPKIEKIPNFDIRLIKMRQDKADFGEGTMDQFYIYLADQVPDKPMMSRQEFIELYNRL